MALKRPRHKVDAPILFVPEGDDAWDEAKIAADKAAMEEAGENPDRHPVSVYFSGETRFCLSAPSTVLGEERCAGDYLDESKRPVKFKLKRLPYDQFYEVQGVISKKDWNQAAILACEYGLEGIEGCPELHYARVGPRVSRRTMEALFEGGQALPVDIGTAVILASYHLTEAEKKA